MTTFDRFDPFERRISEAIDEVAAARLPVYLDDVLRQTARTPQRPRWTFPERWLPMDTMLVRPRFARRVPVRQLVILALAGLMALASFAYIVGSQRPSPAPFGPAGNGQLIYGFDGDVYARDSLYGDPRLILAGQGDQYGVIVSPDGRLIAYDNFDDADAAGNPREWVANVDGTNPRRILDRPYTFEAFEWAPDSRSIAIVTRPGRDPELWIAPADGSGARQLEFEGFVVWGATWDPARAGVLLVRGADRVRRLTDLYYVTVDGTVLEKLGLAPQNLNGPQWELSGMAFSPDGSRIAYNSIEAVEPPVNRFRAHVMDRDGSNDQAIEAPIASGFSQAWPSFSPDGDWILLSSWETRPDGSVDHRLAIAPADLSAPARLIGPVLDDENQIKSWSPDGTRILLCACESREIYAVDPITGDFEKLPWSADAPSWQRVAR